MPRLTGTPTKSPIKIDHNNQPPMEPILIIGKRVLQGSPAELAEYIRTTFPGARVARYSNPVPGEYDLCRPYEAEVLRREKDGLLWDCAKVAGNARQIGEIQRGVA